MGLRTYSDKIDWDFQVGFAVDYGYDDVLNGLIRDFRE